MTRKLNVRYGEQRAVRMVSMLVPEKKVTAFIGPSGCGKSTLLRCFNRMNDLITGCTIDGSILIDGKNIYGDDVNVHMLRRNVGMVFQKSNPFPKSIFENVAFGLRLKGDKKKAELEATVEQSLRDVGLWEEVSERLHESAIRLSGGQQQRLCIARALATEPRVLLMDEPCSALDPIATSRIEELIGELSKRITILIVTHNMQQAARISDWTAFLMQGELVEFDKTDVLFQQPADPRTDDYIRGRFG